MTSPKPQKEKADMVAGDTRAREAPAWARFVERRIGQTPNARLTWLFARFFQAHLEALADQEWAEWRTLLEAFAASSTLPWLHVGSDTDSEYDRQLDHHDVFSPEDIGKVSWQVNEEFRREIVDCRTQVKKTFGELAAGKAVYPLLGRVMMRCQIVPVGPTSGRRARLVRVFGGSLVARVLLAGLEQLVEVGPHRLRACEFRAAPETEACGQLFIASKRQKYCSKEHTARAMYLKWKQRGAPRGTRREHRREPGRPVNKLSRRIKA